MQRPNAVTTALKLFVILLLALTLAACASKDRPRPGDVAADGEAVGVDTEVRPLGRDGRPIAGPMGRPGSAISQRLVYFDFDRDAIASEFLPVVNAHAEYLANNPQARIRLEGHTDERGSREYNLGLGERRAMAVQRQMLLQGARASQIRVISYGEELPAQMGSDEQAWAQNRRVEIVYERGSQ